MLQRRFRTTPSRVAPLRRRLLARAIDGVLTMLPILWILRQVKPGGQTPSSDQFDPERIERRRVTKVWSLAIAPFALLQQLGASPGIRVAGLRPVHARTGQPIELPEALTRVVLEYAFSAATSRLANRLTAAERARADQHATILRELEPELRALHSKHADDPVARNEAIAAFYKEHAIGLSCVAMAKQMAIPAALTLLSKWIRERIMGGVKLVRRN